MVRITKKSSTPLKTLTYPSPLSISTKPKEIQNLPQHRLPNRTKQPYAKPEPAIVCPMAQWFQRLLVVASFPRCSVNSPSHPKSRNKPNTLGYLAGNKQMRHEVSSGETNQLACRQFNLRRANPRQPEGKPPIPQTAAGQP